MDLSNEFDGFDLKQFFNSKIPTCNGFGWGVLKNNTVGPGGSNINHFIVQHMDLVV